jgi:ADP-ribose pyrophosphatase
MSLTETVTGAKTVFEGHVVTLKVYEARLEDGRESKREIVEHRGAVAMVPLTSDGDVLLVRQFRLATGGELLEIPAGTLDHGEEPLAAAEREIEEEVGMKAGKLELLGSFFVSPGWCSEKITVYLATELTPSSQNLDEDEVIEVVSMPFHEALETILNSPRNDAKTLTGLLLAQRRLNGG